MREKKGEEEEGEVGGGEACNFLQKVDEEKVEAGTVQFKI